MAAAILKMKRGAPFLVALMIMAMFLSSQGKILPKIVCFEGKQDCSDRDCQKQCEKSNFGLPRGEILGQCVGLPYPNPYNLIDCCCFRKS